MTPEEIEQMIKSLEAVRYEWTCLIPRLSHQFRRNAEHCKGLTEEVLATLKKSLEAKI